MLTFLSNGLLYSPFAYNDDPDNPVVSTKTQYAGLEAHIAVIKLLAYLKQKYFARFDLMDEGYYWETNDLEALRQQFDRYNFALDFLEKALNELPASGAANPADLAQRIEELLQKKWKGFPGGENKEE